MEAQASVMVFFTSPPSPVQVSVTGMSPTFSHLIVTDPEAFTLPIPWSREQAVAPVEDQESATALPTPVPSVPPALADCPPAEALKLDVGGAAAVPPALQVPSAWQAYPLGQYLSVMPTLAQQTLPKGTQDLLPQT